LSNGSFEVAAPINPTKSVLAPQIRVIIRSWLARIVLMKQITVENYRSDKYYARVVGAVDSILGRGDCVSPIEVFIEMGLLSIQSVVEWRAGRLPFLERGIQCNLSAASRILRLLRMHAHDLNLRPSGSGYVRRTRGRRSRLRFTKSGDLKVEEAYACHFVRVVSKQKGSPLNVPKAAAGCVA
jgi:hypothetical protein